MPERLGSPENRGWTWGDTPKRRRPFFLDLATRVSEQHRVRPRLKYVLKGDGRLGHDLDPRDRAPQDACGVFGVWAPGEDVSKLTYYGLYALQHRGQEAAGMAGSGGPTGGGFKEVRLLAQGFDEGTLSAPNRTLPGGHRPPPPPRPRPAG